MASTQPELVHLDQIAADKLPERITAAISEMELTVAEMLQYEESKPTLSFAVRDSEVIIEIRARVPIKKMLAILGSASAFLWLATNFEIFRHLTSLLALLQGGQPGPP